MMMFWAHYQKNIEEYEKDKEEVNFTKGIVGG